MQFDNINNLLVGGIFKYIDQEGGQVVFKAIDKNKIKILVDKNLNGVFEDDEKTDIILEN